MVHSYVEPVPVCPHMITSTVGAELSAMAEQYSRHVSKIVVSQLAETAGFHAVQESAVDVLADLMLRYIAQLGSASHSYAELAGRTDCNINDLVSAPTQWAILWAS